MLHFKGPSFLNKFQIFKRTYNVGFNVLFCFACVSGTHCVIIAPPPPCIKNSVCWRALENKTSTGLKIVHCEVRNENHWRLAKTRLLRWRGVQLLFEKQLAFERKATLRKADPCESAQKERCRFSFLSFLVVGTQQLLNTAKHLHASVTNSIRPDSKTWKCRWVRHFQRPI